MVSDPKNEEPAWAKYITEDNLPTEDLQYLCSIIGLEATKKLMFIAAGEKFSIHAHCNQPYKKRYIREHFDGTRKSMLEITKACRTTQRYVYKVLEEQSSGKKSKK